MVEAGSCMIEGKYLDQDFSFKQGQIKVVDGKISDVGESLGDADISYSDEYLIFPGFIDIHVHARDFFVPKGSRHELEEAYDSHTRKEDYVSVSRAAINGGVVAFADMPNNPFPPKDSESYVDKRMLAGHKCSVDSVIYSLLTPASRPFADVPYKLYTHDFSKSEIRTLLNHFAGIEYDPVIAVHCENNAEVKRHHLRPASAEIKDVEYILDLASKFKLSVHIAHVSAAKSLDMIVSAKQSGVKVTCETTPTYLFFSKENKDQFRNRKLLTMKPPIRTEYDRQRLLEGVMDGEIDYLATDHAPHTLEDKKKGAFGIPLIDHYTAFVGWLMQTGVSDKIVCSMCCENPGLFVGRYLGENFGKIKKGYIGSFTVLGKKDPAPISSADVRTRCAWSPFDGAFLGDDYSLYAHDTIVRGVPLKSDLNKKELLR